MSVVKDELMLCQSTFGEEVVLTNSFDDKSSSEFFGIVAPAATLFTQSSSGKRGRKPRKPNEKELLLEHSVDLEEISMPLPNSRKHTSITTGSVTTRSSSSSSTAVAAAAATTAATSAAASSTKSVGGNQRRIKPSKEGEEVGSQRRIFSNKILEEIVKKTCLNEDTMTKPKSVAQEQYLQGLKNPEKRIVIATGPAGTGKTVFGCEYGIHQLLKGVYERMIFTRPLVSVDEEFGFLPGTMEEKMAPWIRPIYDVLSQYISIKEIQMLMDEKIIEIVPLGFMRGRTFKNALILADEMQNSTPSQMKMLLTRIGTGSKMVLTGDLEQCDHGMHHHYAKQRRGETIVNGLDDFLKRFIQAEGKEKEAVEEEGKEGGEEGKEGGEERRRGPRCCNRIVHFEFLAEDIQREPVVRDVLAIYGK